MRSPFHLVAKMESTRQCFGKHKLNNMQHKGSNHCGMRCRVQFCFRWGLLSAFIHYRHFWCQIQQLSPVCVCFYHSEKKKKKAAVDHNNTCLKPTVWDIELFIIFPRQWWIFLTRPCSAADKHKMMLKSSVIAADSGFFITIVSCKLPIMYLHPEDRSLFVETDLYSHLLPSGFILYDQQ